MKTLVSVVMLLSFANPRLTQPLHKPVDPTPVQHARKGGRWYLAASGHAVYCLGPVRMLPDATGGRLSAHSEGHDGSSSGARDSWCRGCIPHSRNLCLPRKGYTSPGSARVA